MAGRSAVGRYTVLFVALGLLLWYYQTEQKKKDLPEVPTLPDHPLIRAKLETETLLNEGLALARAYLVKDGEFQPFASGLTFHREIQLVASDANDGKSSQEVVALLEQSLREEKREQGYKAIAIVSDVRFEVTGEDEPRPAVQITLEHQDGYCVDVIAPYEREGEIIHYQPLMASSRAGRVFEGCRRLPNPDEPLVDLRES